MAESKQTKQTGFTLVELLITLAILLIVVASLSSTFVFQRKTYDTQQQINEMVQNGRAAMDLMTSEMMMTGYGVTSQDLSTWLNWATGVVTFVDDPVVIEDGIDGGSDIIHVAGCFDGTVATLSADALAGATQIQVVLTQKELDEGNSLDDLFDTDDEYNICISGIERAYVTNVDVLGSTLTIDTDPLNGDGLLGEHYIGESVCVVKIISYSIVLDDGSYILKRNENLGAGRQPLAENIIDMQVPLTSIITNTDGNIISWEINPLTSQTEKLDPSKTYQLRSVITPPNLNF
jgi:prepilin-type N-terminal cleavage/methylation domain-containing protein